MLFGLDLEMEAMHPKVKENGRIVINEVLRFVHDRKNGVTKSKMNGVDLLSIFLENQDIFTDEDIAKESQPKETTHQTSTEPHSLMTSKDHHQRNKIKITKGSSNERTIELYLNVKSCLPKKKVQ